MSRDYVLVLDEAAIPTQRRKDGTLRPTLINFNMLRGQTRYFGRATETWRDLGRQLAQGCDKLAPPVSIWALFRFPDNRRRDTANLYPTVKALVDGLVDEHRLVGDHDGVLDGPWLRREYPNGPLRITLVLRHASLLYAEDV